MRRTILLAVATILSTLAASSVSAQQACPPSVGYETNWKYDYYRNKIWPEPFRAMDTQSVLSYFDTQRDKGWRLNNTLGASMFNPQTQQLTESGKAHVRWITTRAPRDRRVVFVLQGDSQAHTAKRIESTQLAVSEYVPVGALPQIYLTDEDAPGSSGAYQTAVHRAINTSVPSPRLPAAPVTSSSGL